MRPIEPCIDCLDLQKDEYGYLCDLACGKRSAWENQIQGYEIGIREAVEFIEKGGETPLGTDRYGYYIWKTKLKAKLKEWGIE